MFFIFSVYFFQYRGIQYLKKNSKTGFIKQICLWYMYIVDTRSYAVFNVNCRLLKVSTVKKYITYTYMKIK